MSPIRMSKIESGMRVVLEFNEAFNRHDVTGMMQLLSDDCVFEERKRSVNFFKTFSASHRRLTSKSKKFLEWDSAV
jgi:hypothetical protein